MIKFNCPLPIQALLHSIKTLGSTSGVLHCSACKLPDADSTCVLQHACMQACLSTQVAAPRYAAAGTLSDSLKLLFNAILLCFGMPWSRACREACCRHDEALVCGEGHDSHTGLSGDVSDSWRKSAVSACQGIVTRCQMRLIHCFRTQLYMFRILIILNTKVDEGHEQMQIVRRHSPTKTKQKAFSHPHLA